MKTMCIRLAIALTTIVVVNSEESRSFSIVQKVIDQCENNDDMFKCLKIQAIKAANRAIRLQNFTIFDGVSFVTDDRQTKEMRLGLNLNDTKLEMLNSEQLDDLLSDTTAKFFNTHQLEISIPKLLPPNQEEGNGIEEARRRRRRRRGGGNAALYWALAIKGTFLAMAYKGIAVMSGMALMMGKMALLLTAILGLKKLVNSGQETTTLEIIKKPKHSESHSYSNSYEDEGYHKSYDRGDSNISKTIYRAYLPHDF